MILPVRGATVAASDVGVMTWHWHLKKVTHAKKFNLRYLKPNTPFRKWKIMLQDTYLKIGVSIQCTRVCSFKYSTQVLFYHNNHQACTMA